MCLSNSVSLLQIVSRLLPQSRSAYPPHSWGSPQLLSQVKATSESHGILWRRGGVWSYWIQINDEHLFVQTFLVPREGVPLTLVILQLGLPISGHPFSVCIRRRLSSDDDVNPSTSSLDIGATAVAWRVSPCREVWPAGKTFTWDTAVHVLCEIKSTLTYFTTDLLCSFRTLLMPIA